MEVPKKIYSYPSDRAGEGYVECTHTDALIDKASTWFNNNFIIHDEYGIISDSFNTKEEMFEDFVKYMKGE